YRSGERLCPPSARIPPITRERQRWAGPSSSIPILTDSACAANPSQSFFLSSFFLSTCFTVAPETHLTCHSSTPPPPPRRRAPISCALRRGYGGARGGRRRLR